MASYSPQLQYVLNRISGFTTNTFKLQPNGSSEAVAGQIVRIALPQNSLVNFKSFAFHFDAQIHSATAQGRLPPNVGIGSLIERVEVTCGGLQIAAGNNFYNVLAAAKQAVMGEMCDPILGHPEVVRDKSYHQSGSTHTNANGMAKTNGNIEGKAHYVVDKWCGFLGSVAPSIIDLGLLAEVVIQITLASNSVCIDAAVDDTTVNFTADAAAPGPAPVYKLSDMYATVECCGFSDGTYESMVSAQMSQVGYLELPFKNYISFQDHSKASVKFSVASQSISRIWIVHRDDNFQAAKGAVRILGHRTNNAAGIFNEVMDYNKERYTSTAFNFPLPPDDTNPHQKHYLTINGAMIPQWQASVEDMFQITKNSVLGGKHQMKYGLLTMKANYGVFCVRLNLPESEYSNTLTGLDSRGISANMFYNMHGVSAEKHINIFVECDSCLRIGQGLQAEIIA
jgi:hypothetical protein